MRWGLYLGLTWGLGGFVACAPETVKESGPRSQPKSASETKKSKHAEEGSAVPPRGRGLSKTSAQPAQCRPDFVSLAAKLRPQVLPVIHQSRGLLAPSSTHSRAASQGKTKSSPGGATRKQEPEKLRYGLGSGILINKEGQVLTNAHVVAGAQQVILELQDQRQVHARVLAVDARVDLALLEIPDFDPSGFVAPSWFEGSVATGQWVLCMGHPFGLGHTVTVGVISGQGRDYDDLGRPPSLHEYGWWSFLQLDAAINAGNSGGPVVDTQGRILGIATAVRNDGQGLAFAVPAPMARRFVNDVQKFGFLRKAVLGMRVLEVGPEVVPNRLQNVQVQKVVAGGPAQKAGLAVGDVILRAQDKAVHRISTLVYEAQVLGPGMTLRLQVLSDPLGEGRVRELNLVLRAQDKVDSE